MKELSKEEILAKRVPDFTKLEKFSDKLIRANVHAAMDEYAAQKDAEISRLQARVKGLEGEAVRFGGFIHENHYEHDVRFKEGRWYKLAMFPQRFHTTLELYSIYKQSK